MNISTIRRNLRLFRIAPVIVAMAVFTFAVGKADANSSTPPPPHPPAGVRVVHAPKHNTKATHRHTPASAASVSLAGKVYSATVNWYKCPTGGVVLGSAQRIQQYPFESESAEGVYDTGAVYSNYTKKWVYAPQWKVAEYGFGSQFTWEVRGVRQ